MASSKVRNGRAVELVDALARLTVASDLLRFELADRLGVAPIDLRAVSMVGAEDHPLSPKELGARLGLTTGSMTALVDRLESKGFVERQPHPSDRRSLTLHLTPAGRDAHEWAREHYARAATATLADLPEPATATPLLTALTSALDAAHPGCGRPPQRVPHAP